METLVAVEPIVETKTKYKLTVTRGQLSREFIALEDTPEVRASLVKIVEDEINGAPAHELAYIADKDAARIKQKCYQKANRTEVELQNKETAIRGRSRRIFMNGGYATFKASYLAAEDALYSQIVPILQRMGGCLDLEWHFEMDSDINCTGDFGWFNWRICYE